MSAQQFTFWRHVEKTADCWLWKGCTFSNGYGRVRRYGQTHVAHRFAWELVNGPIEPSGLLVCHRCDVRACVNPANLFLGTDLDNVRDCIVKGRRASPLTGSLHPRAKLDESAIVLIRERRAAGEQLAPIANDFGVTKAMISYIANNRNWTHV